MTKYSRAFIGLGFVLSLTASSAVIAGEIKGPPPDGNLPPQDRLSSGNSFCSYSGLNDTPDGAPEVGDPGGIAQSYGYFLGQADAFDPSDPDERDSFFFPGTGCNASLFPLGH
ncbi:MAG TPA: hypothetical protein VFK50_01080 [Sphingomicrobium sp.]|nr:hypothetical protein [Sphingomicrobium sp.]